MGTSLKRDHNGRRVLFSTVDAAKREREKMTEIEKCERDIEGKMESLRLVRIEIAHRTDLKGQERALTMQETAQHLRDLKDLYLRLDELTARPD